MESESRHHEFIAPASLTALGLLVLASFGAFSRKTKQEIGIRDKWTCQGCGKQFKDGWMVHGAHNPDKHHKGKHYDKASSGKIMCVDCHQDQHEEGTTLGRRGDDHAIQLLSHTDRRTRKWREGK